MCGRFALRARAEALAQQFGLDDVPRLPPRYNIAPGQQVAVVRAAPLPPAGPAPTRPGRPVRRLDRLRWGLVPFFAKAPDPGARMINARSETVADMPAYRNAFRRRRCLLPADGFFEWKRLDKRKQPYFLSLRDGRLFAFAGLWERWEGGGGQTVESCTILTTAPNELVRPLHDRMPVILPEEAYDLWLDPEIRTVERLLGLLRPFPAERMLACPVETLVNNPANDDERCIRPAKVGPGGAPTDLFGSGGFPAAGGPQTRYVAW